jgi:hypothetical protein
MRRRRRSATLAAGLALALAAPAGADQGYEAKWVGQSDYLTLESGETATSSFDAQNIGTATWTNDVVRLGTTNPRDRISAFADASWIQGNRATPLDQPFVEPGGTGRFTFNVTAPVVSADTVFDEYFAPVAERRAWMENDANGWPPNGVYLRYVVIPGRPPSVSISSAPDHVPDGTPITVTAAASDNRRVSRVELSVAGRAAVVDRSAPYTATLDMSGLPPGPVTVHAVAVDGSGRTASADRTVVLDPVPNGAGASHGARMTASFTRKRAKPRTTVRHGRAAYVRGKLVDENGNPITGAVIRVARRVLTGTSGFVEVRPASTGPDGRYAYRLAPGPSRQVRLSYTPFASDAAPTVVKLVRLGSRAGVKLGTRVTRGAVPRVALSGRLLGGYAPRRGVLVVLQAYQRGFGWRTFKTVRARHERFSTGYRFQRASRGTFRFRAVVRAQNGYPWATGYSRVVRVRL